LWLAVGHQHIGFSLSAITGTVMAALIDNRTPPVDPAPYDPARWLGQ
jgi:D-amino-acid dehydrogenase